MSTKYTAMRALGWLWLCALDALAMGVVCAAVLMLVVRLLA